MFTAGDWEGVGFGIAIPIVDKDPLDAGSSLAPSTSASRGSPVRMPALSDRGRPPALGAPHVYTASTAADPRGSLSGAFQEGE